MHAYHACVFCMQRATQSGHVRSFSIELGTFRLAPAAPMLRPNRSSCKRPKFTRTLRATARCPPVRVSLKSSALGTSSAGNQSGSSSRSSSPAYYVYTICMHT